jgi:transcriptional regulator with XRE-family HTH domain
MLRFLVVPQRFNEQLAAYLRRAGIPASTLAERSDVSQSTMSRIALGQRPPDLDVLDRWAEMLDLDPQERAAFTFAGQLAHCPTAIVELLQLKDSERDALLKRIERLEVAVRVLKGEDPEARAAPAARRPPPRAR